MSRVRKPWTWSFYGKRSVASSQCAQAWACTVHVIVYVTCSCMFVTSLECDYMTSQIQGPLLPLFTFHGMLNPLLIRKTREEFLMCGFSSQLPFWYQSIVSCILNTVSSCQGMQQYTTSCRPGHLDQSMDIIHLPCLFAYEKQHICSSVLASQIHEQHVLVVLLCQQSISCE